MKNAQFQIEEIKLNFHLSHWHMAEIKILLLYTIIKSVGEGGNSYALLMIPLTIKYILTF